MNLAELVRRWKAHTGRTGKEIAAVGKLNASKLSEIISGANRNPGWVTIQRIAAGLGVTEEQFFEGPPSKVTAVERVGLPPHPEVHEGSPLKTDQSRARRMIQPPHGPAAVHPDVEAAIAALAHAVDALNAITATFVLADVRQQTAAPRDARTRRRPGPRRNRR